MNYRKIWEKYYGDIPIDENGKKYDIHHIDGNRSNNAIENLIALSIKEHYDIHKNQKDWQACHVIMKRLNLTIEEQLEINKKISEIKKGKLKSDEHKANISKSIKGTKWMHKGLIYARIKKEDIEFHILNGWKFGNKHMTNEVKKKLSEAIKGFKHTEETKKKLSALNAGQNSKRYGTKHSENTLKKMRDIKMGNNNPMKRQDVKDKISKTLLGSRWMYKNDKILLVKEKDIQDYIDSGYKPTIKKTYIKKDGLGNKTSVSKFDLNENFIKDYESITDAIRDLEKKYTSITNIGLVCKGRRKTAAGFIWKFKK